MDLFQLLNFFLIKLRPKKPRHGLNMIIILINYILLLDVMFIFILLLVIG